jgi:hypothetical protein
MTPRPFAAVIPIDRASRRARTVPAWWCARAVREERLCFGVDPRRLWLPSRRVALSRKGVPS